ncbi:hypothetical protein HKBW3S25_00741 [Candidatus Hakubella thermalkaliphila]|uniref:Aminopeptidase n=2 Tax=Candidatus Hakubella thermalkaliphila TaxID=2754717 RepID=A0A6V8NZ33_9ACTN|nr:hypothetical protein HKBW3S25_00741 [Candidatus Hakubella thermalkaliphila]
MKPDFPAIANKIVHECLNIQKGESVLIDVREDTLFLGDLIAIECKKIGADPLICAYSDEFVYRTLTETDPQYLEIPSQIHRSVVEAAQVIISCFMERKDPARSKDISGKRLAGMRSYSKNRWNRLEKGGCRWVGIGFPTAEQAQHLGIDFDSFYRMFWSAVDIDYEKLGGQAAKIQRLLKDSQSVHITNEKGTDLTIELGDRPIFSDDGRISSEDLKQGAVLLNIPSGEVFVAPLHHGTSGRVIFDLIIREGKRIVDLELDFREGRAYPVRAKEGLEHYLDLVNNASGDKNLIAELGIGLNPRITQMVGYTLTDEKIIGTVHIAIGNNKTMGGQNDSDLHWDMIVMKPTVVVDGVMLMEKGRFAEEYS